MHFHGDNLSVHRHVPATLRPAPAAAAVGITARFHFDKWPLVSRSLRVTTMSPRYRSHRRSALALAPARMVECRGRKRYRKLIAMLQLVVASNNPARSCPLRAHVAHHLRNLLATVGLHLETLHRLTCFSRASGIELGPPRDASVHAWETERSPSPLTLRLASRITRASVVCCPASMAVTLP